MDRQQGPPRPSLDELLPPDALIDLVGGGGPDAYRRIGADFLALFLELGHLEPDDHVLDVGCGSGRIAVPLTRYLSPTGSYRGFDVVRSAVDWCTKSISSSYPHFVFEVADVSSKVYNPNGRYRASEYIFPYPSESFDFVVLASVFTHMLPPDMTRYTFEIARVLKRGGRCLVTFFLATLESLACIGAKQSSLPFERHSDGYWTIDLDNPEAALCYDEARIRTLYAEAGLTINESVHYGGWYGREAFLCFQDVIVAVK